MQLSGSAGQILSQWICRPGSRTESAHEHTFFGTAPQPVARVDIFGRPPRVSKLTSDENPLYLSRSGVAQMKKTRREKGWAFANLLGAQMLEHGDIAGVLNVTGPSLLREAVRSSELPPEFILERPTLTLAGSDSPELTRYLKAEKEFWIRLDDLRLSAYEEAWNPYGAILQQNPDLLPYDERIKAIAEYQQNFETPHDRVWPAEGYTGPDLP